MTQTQVILLFLGMTLVTFLPRALPAILPERMKFGRRIEKFLKLIPYTAMSALIVPGLFSAHPDHPLLGIISGAVAALLAYFKCPVMVCVLAAIGVNLVATLLI